MVRVLPRKALTPDEELLARFIGGRDEEAFAALMERHGAMVLGVCQRLLRHAQDAEDACQAVFLVLARRAAAVRQRGSLASWLHGVARRVAGKLQTSQARRRAREAVAAARQPGEAEPPDLSWREALRLVDEELQRLPQAYRAPLVLCYLEGRTQDEAARELGWALGALRGRLARGREKLRARLVRRGVTGAAAVSLAALVPGLGAAAVPPGLIAATARASVPMATGQSVPAAVPARVVELARTSLPVSFGTPLVAGVILAAAAVLAALVTLFSGDQPAPEPGPPPPRALQTWSAARRLEVPNHAWSVTFSPDGKRLAAGSGGVIPTPGTLHVWDVATGEPVFALDTERSVRCVTFSPDGRRLATAEHNGAARVRDPATGEVVFTLHGHASNLDVVTFSPDGKLLATCSWDGTVKLWDPTTGQLVRTLGGIVGQCFGVAFAAGGLVASGGAGGTALVQDPVTGETRSNLWGHGGTIHWLAASPDGATLATAGWDRTVRLWDTATGKHLATLHGHHEPVLAVTFSPDGKRLASCSGVWSDGKTPPNVPAPGEVIVWDLTTRLGVARLPHPDRVFGTAFSPDGNTLAAACWDGSVVLWQASPAGPALPGTGEDKENAGLQFVQAATDADAPPEKSYAADFHPELKVAAKEIPGLAVYGPEASACVKFEPAGVRIALPPGYPRQRSGTGVVTDFGVRGDFEVTAAFEILDESWPGRGGNPTDLRLVVVPDERPQPDVWFKSSQNRAYLARDLARPNRPGQFVADAPTWNPELPRDKWGNEIFDKIEVPRREVAMAAAPAGRLRLMRRGPTVYFFAGDGPGQSFTLLHKAEFGTRDLRDVRVVGSTGWPDAALDVRVTDLRVRADAFLKGTEAPAPAVTRRRPHLLLLGLAVPLALAVLALATWWFARRRLAAPVAVAEPAATVHLECPACGKRLRARGARPGRRIKCPGCGQTVEVPPDAPDGPEEAS